MKRFFFLFLLALQWAAAADFDCIFIGSSPIPLFEALYQRHLGKSVLILEQSEVCGGAWKSIDICGVAHADLGCHQIGSDPRLREFLELYAGCRIANHCYFSEGCYELIRNLTTLVERTGISLLLNTRAEKVLVDFNKEEAIVTAGSQTFSAKEIFHTPLTPFQIENIPSKPPTRHTQWRHLYLLIQDPTPPQFFYLGSTNFGATRAMNLTSSLDLHQTGRQLLVFQVRDESSLHLGQQFLDGLKQASLVDPAAYIIQEEPYIYETHRHSPGTIPSDILPYFHSIEASNFGNMTQHIDRWTTVFPPFQESR